MAEPQRARMTVPEFLRWQELQEDRYELLDGEPVLHRMMTGASQRHDLITLNALTVLRTKLRGTGCRPTTADVAVELPSGSLRRPDAAIDRGPLREADYIASKPVLVIEVLSPSTRQIDRFRKLEEYKSVGSIRYILLVEPSLPAAKLYMRDGPNLWRSADLTGFEAVIRITDPDVELSLHELYDGLSLATLDRPQETT